MHRELLHKLTEAMNAETDDEARMAIRALTRDAMPSDTLSQARKYIHTSLISTFQKNEFAQCIRAAKRVMDTALCDDIILSIAGISNQRLGNIIEAKKLLHSAYEISPNDPQHSFHLGNFYLKIKNYEKAEKFFTSSLDKLPDNSIILNNLGLCQQNMNKIRESIITFKKCISIKQNHIEAHNNLAISLMKIKAIDEAICHFNLVIKIKPDQAEALYNLSLCYREKGNIEVAINQIKKYLTYKSQCERGLVTFFNLLALGCEWSSIDENYNTFSALSLETGLGQPFPLLALEDNPSKQLERSVNWYKARVVGLGQTSFELKTDARKAEARKANVRKQISIGYFGADFHDHATMHLLRGVLREHDTERFKINIYSYGPKTDDAMQHAARAYSTKFVDLSTASNQQINDTLRRDELDIVIDIKGYTKHSRSLALYQRVAPIQINFLGYPGTMGAEFIDYIIADPTVVSQQNRQFISEAVIYLPHSYQPNDNQREISRSAIERSALGLPDDHFVFCCFNNSYKISKVDFLSWCRIMSKIPNSVLWLLAPNPLAQKNILDGAAASGIDPSRMIFAPKVSQGDHLARLRHADLMLDTSTYNGHTTTSDALWAGTPVVTLIGKQFAARVGASLLSAAGLANFVCEDRDKYEAVALAYAKRDGTYHKPVEYYRKNKQKTALFDTLAYTRHFEAGLYQVYNNHVSGVEKQDVWVATD